MSPDVARVTFFNVGVPVGAAVAAAAAVVAAGAGVRTVAAAAVAVFALLVVFEGAADDAADGTPACDAGTRADGAGGAAACDAGTRAEAPCVIDAGRSAGRSGAGFAFFINSRALPISELCGYSEISHTSIRAAESRSICDP